MENAGRGIAECIENKYPDLENISVLVVCGKGNNGGDGYVVARHLFNKGAKIIVLSLANEKELKEDPKVNYFILKKISRLSNNNRLSLYNYKSLKDLKIFSKIDLIVDAIFGTGFNGEVRKPYSEIINWINNQKCHKISIDVPSGVNADTGEVVNIAVKANMTLTMDSKKIGLICNQGAECAGEIINIDISIPRVIETGKSVKTFLVNRNDVRVVLPKRPRNAHKHSVGKIYVIAGSPGYTGAAAMTSVSALRAGAGTVILGTPASVYPILARKLTEVMVEPLPDTSKGTLSLKAFEVISKRIDWADIIICGPGISRDNETCQLIWQIVMECKKPILIDADGLNNLSEKISILKNHLSKDIIITPHTGELSRITGITSKVIDINRVSIARKIAKQYKLTLVLKGAPTVVSDENGFVYVNSTGNPGMATAGMGDVLAGIIGGLWAQGMQRTIAAYTGVYVHGYAGEQARNNFGEKSLLASDVQNYISRSFLEIERNNIC